MLSRITVLGAAYLAGLAVGYWRDEEEITTNWAIDRVYTPSASRETHDERYAGWKRAVERALHWEQP